MNRKKKMIKISRFLTGICKYIFSDSEFRDWDPRKANQ